METEATAPARLHAIEFHGDGGEYFRIWIVNLLLTVVTIGIYGAWAKVRRMRYFYGNTVLAGSSFEYHGEPKKILKGRLMAGALIAPYYIFQKSHPLLSAAFILLFLIALPFIVVQSRRFQMRVSSWRNVRFGFDGSFGAAARIYLGLGALVPLTLGILFPYLQFSKQRFLINESRFGRTKFAFSARPGRYYAAYGSAIGWWFAGLAAVIALVLTGIGIAALFGAFRHTAVALNPTNPKEFLSMTYAAIIGILIYLGLLVTLLISGAVLTSRTTNESLNNTRLGNNQLQSKLSAKKLLRIYLVNLVLILITLGMYSPWAKIRLLRYRLESTGVMAAGNLDEFIQTESVLPSATGEELGDFLDVDFGF